MMQPKRTKTFQEFQKIMEGHTDIQTRLEDRVKATQTLHDGLKTATHEELREFGASLETAIRAHEDKDTLAEAHKHGRVVFRSWHVPGATDAIDGFDGLHPRIGIDSLNVSLNPEFQLGYKQQYRAGQHSSPTMELSTTLLAAGEEKQSVFSRDNGTVTALLPEVHQAAFLAYNEAVKHRRRNRQAGDAEKEGSDDQRAFADLVDHARSLRATVTRPTLFDKDDLGSATSAVHGAKEGPAHVRKTDQRHDAPGLKTTFESKMNDPLRRQAVFYESFSPNLNPKAGHNEMLVKFRQTGKTAPLNLQEGKDAELRAIVPALGKDHGLNVRPSPQNENTYRYVPKTLDPLSADPLAPPKKEKSSKK
ncbi:hypothetical protein [Burkholderia glumae]|uniref:hypothetical protein n=2 Tax=Burkholderia glumae TaxID=337 RepID=UPI0011D1812B|nr:hypothetical protein [Burkholderia glumae]QJP71087.1 hypothetical protein HJC54_12210 [Burkholderia glumae]